MFLVSKKIHGLNEHVCLKITNMYVYLETCMF